MVMDRVDAWVDRMLDAASEAVGRVAKPSSWSSVLVPFRPGAAVSGGGAARVVDLSQARLAWVRPEADETTDLKTEVRFFDHSSSRSTSVESIRLAQRTDLVVIADIERAVERSATAGIHFVGVAEAKADLLDNLRTRHSIEQRTEILFEQMTQLNVPAHTHVKLVVRWKLSWKAGTARLVAGGEMLDVPYFVANAIRFDKKAVDL